MRFLVATVVGVALVAAALAGFSLQADSPRLEQESDAVEGRLARLEAQLLTVQEENRRLRGSLVSSGAGPVAAPRGGVAPPRTREDEGPTPSPSAGAAVPTQEEWLEEQETNAQHCRRAIGAQAEQAVLTGALDSEAGAFLEAQLLDELDQSAQLFAAAHAAGSGFGEASRASEGLRVATDARVRQELGPDGLQQLAAMRQAAGARPPAR